MPAHMESQAERMAVPSARRPRVLLAAAVIALMAFAAYHNTFSVPLLFDDEGAIKTNVSIRHLTSLGSVLFPPNDVGSGGRPLLNLTFALNYAIGGVSVRGYHVLNLLIHILAGITLFGIVRTTLSLPRFSERYGKVALLLALTVAAVWTLHPVQTESVTYISQRAESLMGLFYLLTLYFFIRAALSSTPTPWAALAVTTCALGMMTKEVMASAPIIVLLYDRAFIAGTFREALRRHWKIYLGLAATWIVLAGLMLNSNLLNRDVGYGTGLPWWMYALTQSKAVVDYLKLSLWPHPLVFDYGPVIVNRIAVAAPYLTLLALLVGLTLVALRRWPGLGFLGAWFFLILAPTSSIIPIAGEPMAENRIYLPLAAVVTLGILGLYSCIGRKSLLIAFPVLAAGLGFLTVERNSVYKDEITIWADTVLKAPYNFRAHYNMGVFLAKIPGRLSDTIAQYEAALNLNYDYPEAHNNLGNALATIPGRMPEAIAHYEAALKIDPNYADAQNDLGNALAATPGRLAEAVTHYEAALKINPNYAEVHNGLGNVLAKIPGRLPDAIAHFETALRINPEYAAAHSNLGLVLGKYTDRLPEAIAHFKASLKIEPNDPFAHNDLGVALVKLPGRLPDAIAEFEAALAIKPDYPNAHNNLAMALERIPGRMPDAIAHYEAALKIDPNYAIAHNNLGIALAKTQHSSEAITHFEAALKIKPDYAEAHNDLGNVLAGIPGRMPEAIAQFQVAVKLAPDFSGAHFNLANAFAATPGRMSDAVDQFEIALQIDPGNATAQNDLGAALARIPERSSEAIPHFEAAIKVKPDYAAAHNNLGIALAKLPGRLPDAIVQFEAAVTIDPDYAEAQFNLGHALLEARGRTREAWAHFDAVARLRPDLKPLLARLRSAHP